MLESLTFEVSNNEAADFKDPWILLGHNVVTDALPAGHLRSDPGLRRRGIAPTSSRWEAS